MSTFRKSALAAATVVMLGGGSVARADVIIDLFTDPAGGQEASTTAAPVVSVAAPQAGPFASIVGGYRDLSVTKTADPLGPGGQARTRVNGGGSLIISNDTGVVSTSLVTWDGVNDAFTNGVNTSGLDVDLTSGGVANSFLAHVKAADLGFGYKIRVWDTDGSQATLSAAVQFQVLSSSAGDDATYLFDWFQLADGTYCNGVSSPPNCTNPLTELDFSILRGGNLGAIDFHHISAMQLELYNSASSESADFALGTVRAVPEPSALGLAGMALLGAAFARRRGKSDKA